MTDPLVVKSYEVRVEMHEAGDVIEVGSDRVALTILDSGNPLDKPTKVRVAYLSPPG